MKIPIEVGASAASAPPSPVEYRWDPDTEILSAQISPRAEGSGMSGSVGLEGADGSWLILDVSAGHINGIEVAVWPDVQKRQALPLPGTVHDEAIRLPARRSQPGIASLEFETDLRAESDDAERVFHFTLGKRRETRTFRIARDLLLDVDGTGHLAGLWLLNVPPFPVIV